MPRSGPWCAFGEEWFRVNQRRLLWLLNGPLRRWARRVLAIHPSDCPPGGQILGIAPNRIEVASPVPGCRRLIFRTHAKYSKRVYYAAKPLWWAMHGWDLGVDRWAPELSFGYSTLTSYPDPNPETSSFDGYTGPLGDNGTYSYVRSKVGGITDDDSSPTALVALGASVISNWFSIMTRGVVLFDTSSLSGATINSAALSVAGASAAMTDLGATTLHLVATTTASNTGLTTTGTSYSDYNAMLSVGTTSFGNVASAAWAVNAYNDYSLTGAGLANVNASGASKFGLRTGWDLINTVPVWSANKTSRFEFYTADNTGTSYDPKLVVDYQNTISKSRSDSGTLSATEARTLVGSSSRADSGTLSATESSQLLGLLSRADGGTFSAVEVSSVLKTGIVFLERSDGGTLSATETSSLTPYDPTVVLTRTDGGTLSAVETSGPTVLFERADGGTLSATESSSLSRLRLPPPSAAALRVAPWLKPGS